MNDRTPKAGGWAVGLGRLAQHQTSDELDRARNIRGSGQLRVRRHELRQSTNVWVAMLDQLGPGSERGTHLTLTDEAALDVAAQHVAKPPRRSGAEHGDASTGVALRFHDLQYRLGRGSSSEGDDDVAQVGLDRASGARGRSSNRLVGIREDIAYLNRGHSADGALARQSAYRLE